MISRVFEEEKHEIVFTPFSTLAKIKGSLPTDSTTPDRLRWWAAGHDRQTMISARFFEEEKHEKTFFFSRPPSNPEVEYNSRRTRGAGLYQRQCQGGYR